MAQQRFAGRTVIVTGAGSGIGKATAVRIAQEGGRVVAADLRQERLDALASEHPGLALVPVAGDVSQDETIARLLQAAGGRVDGLVNVAGIMDSFQPVHEVDLAQWERVFAINLVAPMKLMKAVVPGMLEAGKGAIVNISSEAAFRGSAAGAAYTSSKHALAGLTKSSAVMYAKKGIRVNSVAPGPVATNIEAHFASELAQATLGPLMQAVVPPVASAEQVAAAITWLLSDDSANVTGVILASDGGWSAI